MKITRNDKNISLAESIADKLYPNAYSYDGQLDKLKCHIDLQSEMITTLVKILSSKLNLTIDDIEMLLGYGYEVEE